MKPDVLILEADYQRMDEIMERVLAAFPFPWAGKRVVLKPNILGPYPPEKAVTTHPSLVRSLTRALKERGAVCLVGDNPGLNGYAANERCARLSGIFEAAEGCFVNFARETVAAPVRSRFFQKLAVSRAVLEADWVINLPKFKTHMQTRLTGAVKNMFGILAGAEKARVHLAAFRPQDFAEALVDIYQIRPPDLTIMDAVVGMEGNGPSGTDLRRIGKVLAAENGVSLDGLMAAMVGLKPGSMSLLRIASRRGLGKIDPGRMEIQGTWSRLESFRMPLTFPSRGLLGALVNKLYYRPMVKSRISFRRDLCTSCGVCARHCPAQALKMPAGAPGDPPQISGAHGHAPLLTKKKCISCFCCYELCSSRAIELTGWIGRWEQGLAKPWGKRGKGESSIHD
ncbi:MAG: DUF362 domain-containing protein [Deltaproteobacteria bacterium]|nr:DUF362 domain-containing protein [Deltaproteobacteria bacterium]